MIPYIGTTTQSLMSMFPHAWVNIDILIKFMKLRVVRLIIASKNLEMVCKCNPKNAIRRSNHRKKKHNNLISKIFFAR